ncbi:MAG: hypothetical protein GY856_39555 [bacterium]|nr:hypothetical protein [bacterium]
MSGCASFPTPRSRYSSSAGSCRTRSPPRSFAGNWNCSWPTCLNDRRRPTADLGEGTSRRRGASRSPPATNRPRTTGQRAEIQPSRAASGLGRPRHSAAGEEGLRGRSAARRTARRAPAGLDLRCLRSAPAREGCTATPARRHLRRRARRSLLLKRWADAEIAYVDGITLQYPDWWFNIRPSNTEPYLRLVMEASGPPQLAERKAELIALLGEPIA